MNRSSERHHENLVLSVGLQVEEGVGGGHNLIGEGLGGGGWGHNLTAEVVAFGGAVVDSEPVHCIYLRNLVEDKW